MRLVSGPSFPHPTLTIGSLFFSPFLLTHILSSVNKSCVIYTLVLLLVLLGGKEYIHRAPAPYKGYFLC